MSELAEQERRELRVLLVPWQDGYLLLPNACVVEVLRFTEVTPDEESNRKWVTGRFNWRNLSLPLVSYERLLDADPEEHEGKRRILVCHLFSEEGEVPFAGVEVAGMPRLMTIDESALQIEESGEEENDERPLLAKAQVQGMSVTIPDMAQLGQMLAG